MCSHYSIVLCIATCNNLHWMSLFFPGKYCYKFQIQKVFPHTSLYVWNFLHTNTNPIGMDAKYCYKFQMQKVFPHTSLYVWNFLHTDTNPIAMDARVGILKETYLRGVANNQICYTRNKYIFKDESTKKWTNRNKENQPSIYPSSTISQFIFLWGTRPWLEYI